jgi:hypothetical protein
MLLILTVGVIITQAREGRDGREAADEWGTFNGGGTGVATNGDQLLIRHSSDGGFYLLYFSDNGNLYWNAGDTNDICWTSWSPGSMIATNATDWTVDGIGDLNGDGQKELVMRSSTTFQQGGKTKSQCKVLFYTDNGTGKLKASQPASFNLATLWTIQGVGRFNVSNVGASATNAQQVLIRHNTDGGFYLLYFNDNGTLYWDADDTNNLCWTSWSAGSMIATNATDWSVSAIGDVNGDGLDEVIMASTNTFSQGGKTKSYKKVLFFTDNGTGKLKASQPDQFSFATLWSPQGMGRFNSGVVGAASANAEQLLIRHSTDAGYYLLYFNDNGTLFWDADDTNNVCWTSYTAGSDVATNASTLSVQAIGDINGDDQDEMVVRSSQTFEQGGKTKARSRVLFYTDNGTGKLKASQPNEFSTATLWTIQGL